jgi:hypothetical protein
MPRRPLDRPCTAAPALLAALALVACANSVERIGTDCVPSGTDQDLQAAIDHRATVLLCPRAEMMLSAPLILRQGTTLETAGAPSAAADMATVRLSPAFPSQSGAAIVSSGSDITLRAVRFDGNRRGLGAREGLGLIELGPGQNYDVEGCAFTDTPGWTHLHLLEPCETSVVSGNVVESAPRPHADGAALADGFSISCAHTLIEGNQINDISATGIVYFGGPGTTIRNNVITEATTSADSAINVGDAVVPDHTGVVIENNRIVIQSPRYMHVGIAVGLHVWGRSTTVSGVTVRGNQLSGMTRYGLAVDGCLDCTVENNQIAGWHPVPTLDACAPPAAYLAALTVAHASGALQPAFTDEKIDGCLGEADVLGPIYHDYAGTGPMPDYFAFEVALFSQRLEQGLEATALLRGEWEGVRARAQAICPAGDSAGVQAAWRALADAQYGDGLTPDAADARVRAELAASPPGTPCGPPAP